MMNEENCKKLHLTFHGRIIDHLGIQMYQSPIAALAELISNAWDAEAESVNIVLPDALGDQAQLKVVDNGNGMSFDDCQERYLNVGWCRRGDDPDERSEVRNRPILGRKGIGKFAGFGIAEIIRIETISKDSGEKTVFELDINALRTNEYIGAGGRDITVVEYQPPNEARIATHGTTIVLKKLTLKRLMSQEQYSNSIARRFLLHQRGHDFSIKVNDSPLPQSDKTEGVQFVFPRDFNYDELPDGLSTTGEWGTETLSNGKVVKWRIVFYPDPIDEEELRGIAVFSKEKLVQKPFFFNLSGGLGGQHGLEYMSGQVEADFIDLLPEDIISPERQRVNWERDETIILEEWGKKLIKKLLVIWKKRRGEDRQKQLVDKVGAFTSRLGKLKTHERRTVTRALSQLGSIPTLSDEQFKSLGAAILLSWEQGRLHDLIDHIASTPELTVEELLDIMVEAQVITALNAAEAIKTRLLTVVGLKHRIEQQELEVAVRDYIAENPWLVSPEWETYRKERSVKKLLQDAASEAGMSGGDWKGRVDLALSSADHLLVLEFMRPGLRLDWDHIGRFERYVLILRKGVEANTGGPFQRVTGYIVADKLAQDPALIDKIVALGKGGMLAMDWQTLFDKAIATWREFLDILLSHAPDDERLKSLVDNNSD